MTTQIRPCSTASRSTSQACLPARTDGAEGAKHLVIKTNSNAFFRVFRFWATARFSRFLPSSADIEQINGLESAIAQGTWADTQGCLIRHIERAESAPV